jgi:hypothetical protein
MFVEMKINGRTKFLRRVVSVQQVKKGRYVVETRHNGTFRVEGGRHSGGSARDWFLETDGWDKAIVCTSLVDAINVIETM